MKWLTLLECYSGIFEDMSLNPSFEDLYSKERVCQRKTSSTSSPIAQGDKVLGRFENVDSRLGTNLRTVLKGTTGKLEENCLFSPGFDGPTGFPHSYIGRLV